MSISPTKPTDNIQAPATKPPAKEGKTVKKLPVTVSAPTAAAKNLATKKITQSPPKSDEKDVELTTKDKVQVVLGVLEAFFKEEATTPKEPKIEPVPLKDVKLNPVSEEKAKKEETNQ